MLAHAGGTTRWRTQERRLNPAIRPLCSHTQRIRSAKNVLHDALAGIAPTKHFAQEFIPGLCHEVDNAQGGKSDSHVAKHGAYRGKHAVIIGASPTGVLAALQLVKHGFTVSVYEQQDLDELNRAIFPDEPHLTLSSRALQALYSAGIRLPEQACRPFLGSALVTPAGGVQLLEAAPGSVSISRIELTKHLITEACKQHSQSIAFHFGWRLHKAALEVDSAILWNKHSEQKHAVGYDLLVGADGEDSSVRKSLVRQLPTFPVERPRQALQLKRIPLPSLEHLAPCWQQRAFLLHDPHTGATITGSPGAGPHLLGDVLLPEGVFAQLKGVGDYQQLLHVLFPAIRKDQCELLASQLLAAPVSQATAAVTCSPLAGPRVVLLGAAGHSMGTPLGPASSAAVEDCGALDRVLWQAKGNLALVPELYSYGRRADLTAARELAQQLLCSAQPDSDAPEWRVLLLQRYAHSKLAALSFLHRVAPAHVAAPALLSIDHSHERYPALLIRAQRQSAAMDVLLAGTAALAVASALLACSLLGHALLQALAAAQDMPLVLPGKTAATAPATAAKGSLLAKTWAATAAVAAVPVKVTALVAGKALGVTQVVLKAAVAAPVAAIKVASSAPGVVVTAAGGTVKALLSSPVLLVKGTASGAAAAGAAVYKAACAAAGAAMWTAAGLLKLTMAPFAALWGLLPGKAAPAAATAGAGKLLSGIPAAAAALGAAVLSVSAAGDTLLQVGAANASGAASTAAGAAGQAQANLQSATRDAHAALQQALAGAKASLHAVVTALGLGPAFERVAALKTKLQGLAKSAHDSLANLLAKLTNNTRTG